MKDIETSDIVLAAMLKVKGYKLDNISKNGSRGTFLFSNVDPRIMTEYDLGQASVEPVGFNNAIKSLTTAVRRIL